MPINWEVSPDTLNSGTKPNTKPRPSPKPAPKPDSSIKWAIDTAVAEPEATFRPSVAGTTADTTPKPDALEQGIASVLTGIADWAKGIPENTAEAGRQIASDVGGFAKGLGGAAIGAARNVPGLLFPKLPSTRMAEKARELTGTSPIPTETELLTSSPVERAAAEEFVPVMEGLAAIPLAKAAGGVARAVLPKAKSGFDKYGREILANVAEGQAAGLPFVGEALSEGRPGEAGQIAGIGGIADVLLGIPAAGMAVRQAAKQAAREARLPAGQAEEALAQATREATDAERAATMADMSKPAGGPTVLDKLIHGLDIPENQVRIMLEPQAPRTIPLTEYMKAANNWNRNLRSADPVMLRNIRYTDEMKHVNEVVKERGANVAKAVESAAGTMVPVDDMFPKLRELTAKYIGGDIGFDEIAPGRGAVPVVRKNATSLVSDDQAAEMVQRLASEILPSNLGGDAVDIRLLQSLKSRVSNMATWRDAGGGIQVNDKADAIAKEFRKYIDDKIAKAMPTKEQANAYMLANAAYSRARSIRDAFGRALGQESFAGSGVSRSGGQIGKRAIQSSADSGINSILAGVRELTGADLLQDAAYSQIAMMTSGNKELVRKASQFGGAFDEAVMREALDKMTWLGRGARMLQSGGIQGVNIPGTNVKLMRSRPQVIADIYTKAHGMPRVDLSVRGDVPLPGEEGLAKMLEELAGSESGAIGAGVGTRLPFDEANGVRLADELGARFDGFWPDANGNPMAFAFTDPQTKSSFGARTVEEARQGMARLRGQGGMAGADAGSGVDLLTRMALGGAGGSVVGSQIGDTPEERRRNMMIGAGVGMVGSPILTGGGLARTTR